MIKIIDFKPRLYQETILNTAMNANTLICLPTGLGKTGCALLLAVNRLNKFSDSKILVLTPTKPLSNQFYEVFKKNTDLDHKKIILLTGAVKPEKRKELWENASIIVGTPQGCANDLTANRISLKNVSMLVFDESHRAVGDYSYVVVAKKYLEQAKNQRILALTASPGGTREKIKEICENLFIEEVEIRTEDDNDVEPYVKKKDINWVHVELPEEFKEIKKLMKGFYSDKVKKLIKFGITKPASLINKKDLLNLQIVFRKRIYKRDKSAFSGISMVAQALKLSHALELLETQSLASLKKFLDKLQKEDTKAAKIITNDKNITKANFLTQKLIEKKVQHPKMEKICEIVQVELKENPNSKIIVFANFRDTVKEIAKTLKNNSEAKPIELMGQKEGITQKKQIQTIKDFEDGIYNTLICTSVGEEGLDISGCDTAIFYDHVATSIRRIQRTGRVARLEPGKIIFLITKGTRDAAYYWKSHREERKMKYILKEAQNKSLIEEQADLEKF